MRPRRPYRYAPLPLLACLLLSAAPDRAAAAALQLDAQLSQSAIAAGKQQRLYLRLSVKALTAGKRAGHPPVNVALVLDRSGSMQGERIAAARQAAELALDHLASDDTVALVAYNHEVEVLAKAQPLADRGALAEKIRGLKADGRTALHAGVATGAVEVRKFLAEAKVNRVILLSDGLANVGPSTPNDLGELGRQLGGAGISVSTIGLGLDYNEDLMQKLASASDGNHAFVEKPADLARVFKAEFGDALSTAAQDIEITIDCRAGFKPVRVLGREAAIAGQRVSLRLNQLQAENERYVVLELETQGGAPAADATAATLSVDYLDMDTAARARAEASVGARFTASEPEAEASVNKAVMSHVAEQVATEASEKAVELRDGGDIAAARKLLEDNAASLAKARERYAAPGAKEARALEELEKKNRDAAVNLDKNWDKARKAMRADQHKSKAQQSY
jgi:Ca-activated chloride channel family protein